MMISHSSEALLQILQQRLSLLLPDPYQELGEEVLPVSMGSAGLKFEADGRVAWGKMWGSFCHLAMAGGPPHRGSLLGPASAAKVVQSPGRYRQVVDEICRGIQLAAGLEAARSRHEGWVRVECSGTAMAGWLTRAITMENVAVRLSGAAIELPAGPDFRLEREIKNVITVIAKTCHYWRDHTSAARRAAIAALLETMEHERALVQPPIVRQETFASAMQRPHAALSLSLHQAAGLAVLPTQGNGWLGLDCASEAGAVRAMRLLVAANLLARREGTAVFVPENCAGPGAVQAILFVVDAVKG